MSHTFETTIHAPHKIWHGQELAAALEHAAVWLDVHRDELNALNVFPVPDGDTGTNMAMTMLTATANLPDGPSSVATISQLMTRGALLGARGNSGVILSQIFRGFSDTVARRDEIDGRDFAAALDGARVMAYKAVMRPVEGTMLTVIRGAADGAKRVALNGESLDAVLEGAIAGANESLASTPDLLPILKQAGVVDAGGRGIVVILEGMLRYNRGQTDVAADFAASDSGPGANMAFLDQVGELHGEDAFGYCTNFLVVGTGIDFDAARDEIAAMGQSAVIVGDDTMVKVHIHTLNPGQVLNYAVGLGSLDQIKIDNMNAQTDVLTAQRATATSTTLASSAQPAAFLGEIAVVAVAAGEGLSAALVTMGATTVVTGGQSMNPSTEDLLRAVEDSPVDQVIILPNNKNIILAANQLAALTTCNVRVVPTISVPQGLVALSVFNPDHSLDDNANRMASTLSSVVTIELTRAVRDVVLDGLEVADGQFIGLVDDVLTAASDDLASVLTDVLDQADLGESELVTVFIGEDATEEMTASVAAVIEVHLPDAEIDIQAGGQPHYLFIISVE